MHMYQSFNFKVHACMHMVATGISSLIYITIQYMSHSLLYSSGKGLSVYACIYTDDSLLSYIKLYRIITL